MAGSVTLTDTPAWVAVIGVPLMVLGGVVAIEGRNRFVAAQTAMRTGTSFSAPRAATFLPWGIAAVALVGLALVVLQLTGSWGDG